MPRELYFVERVFDAPLERVWHAWTSAADLERWYCPTDLRVLPGSVVCDAVDGGWWTAAVDVPEAGFVAYFYGVHSEVLPGVRLRHSLYYTQDAVEFARRDLGAEHHEIVIDFEGRDASTWVRFTQIGDMPAEQVELTRRGTSSYFDSLEQFLRQDADG